MGMYTQLALNCWLDPKSDPDRFAFLKQLCDPDCDTDELTPPPSLAKDPFASDIDARWILRSGGSWYFPGAKVHGTLGDEPRGMDNLISFHIWTDIKNYNHEWERFLDFLAPLIAASHCDDDVVGLFRYEEWRYPYLIRFDAESKSFIYKTIHEAVVTDPRD